MWSRRLSGGALPLVVALALCGCFRHLGYEGSTEALTGDGGPDAAADGDEPAPAPETCNGVDDDGDGDADEGFECALGSVVPCSFCGVDGTRSCGDDCRLSPCDAACPATTECCDETCVDLMVDPLNCGTCGNPCPVDFGCADGTCYDAS